jgi:hypothetical protein
MRSLALVAISLFVFAAACGDDAPAEDAGSDGAVTVDGDVPDTSVADDAGIDALTDAPPAPDDAGIDSPTPPPIDAAIDGPPSQFCDLVGQSDCEAGERCTQLLADGVPYLGCTADGAVALGGACTQAVDNGADDCVAGTYCIGGECKEICTDVPNSCSSGGCSIYGGTFEQVEGVGLCNPGCDPVQQDCEGANACYVNIGANEALCAGVPAPSVGLGQDEGCYAAPSGQCYLNGCDEGFGAVGYDFASGLTVCAAYCTPSPTHTASTENPGGISNGTSGSCADAGADAHQCRYLNATYSYPEVSDAWGFCVPTASWGDCTTYDLANPQAELYGCVPYSQLD